MTAVDVVGVQEAQICGLQRTAGQLVTETETMQQARLTREVRLAEAGAEVNQMGDRLNKLHLLVTNTESQVTVGAEVSQLGDRLHLLVTNTESQVTFGC